MIATLDAKDWFVLLRGRQYGPYTYAGLVRAAARGIVDPKAGVWCVGWDEWRIARDVPGLFEREPELVPHDQEEGFDSSEGDDRGKSTAKKGATAVSAATKPVADRGSLESAVKAPGSRDKTEAAVDLDSPENDRGKSTGKKGATAVSAATGPVAAVRAPGSRDKTEAAVELVEAPSIDVSAGPPSALAPPQRKPPGHRGGARLAVYSVLAVLLILFGGGWAAISLGIIRVTIR